MDYKDDKTLFFYYVATTHDNRIMLYPKSIMHLIGCGFVFVTICGFQYLCFYGHEWESYRISFTSAIFTLLYGVAQNYRSDTCPSVLDRVEGEGRLAIPLTLCDDIPPTGRFKMYDHDKKIESFPIDDPSRTEV